MRMILGRMVARGYINRDEYLLAMGRAPAHHGILDWLFGGGEAPAPEPTRAEPPAEVGSAQAASDSAEASPGAPPDTLPR
jgi:hypothetical protein